VHMRGLAVGGLGGVGADHVRLGDHGSGIHYHAMHRFDRFGPRYGIYDSYDPYCYYPDEAPKLPPWPPYCS
jgi:hypothetical protein